MNQLAGVAAIFLAAVCGGGGGGGTGGGSGGSGGGSGGGADQLNAEERDTTDRGGDLGTGVQQVSAIADSLFDFDPTIDTAKTAGENAQAIDQNVRNNLGAADGGTTTPCGTVTLSTNTVTVNFGASPGCTLRNGVKVSGTIAVTVNKVMSTVTLQLTMTSMTVNGKALDGTATFATMNGNNFVLNCDVTSGTVRYQANAFTVIGSVNAITWNGMLSSTNGSVTSSATYNMVGWNKGDCYPSSGTLRVQKGAITSTITFSSATASTGQVSVSTGRVTVTTYLPAYGTCGVRDGG